MSDFLTILLIMIGVGLLFLVPAAYFGGKIGITIVTLILTVISCYLLLYAKGLGKSFANSNTPTSLNLEIVLMFLSFAALYAFIGYGSFCLRQVTHGIEGYKIKLLVWFVILIGYPIYLSVSAAISLHNIQKKYYTSDIIITHAIDFPILVDRIKFFNSKTNKASSIFSRYLENYRKVYEIEGLTSKNELMQSLRYYAKLSHTLIPIGFDSFELSWYSVLENKFYKDTFPIDRKKLKVGKNYEGQLTISDMLIHILPNGHVDLLKNEYTDYTHLTPYSKVDFSSVEGQSIDSIWKNHSQVESQYINYENLNNDFEKLKKGTVVKLSAEEILSFRSVHSYGIDIELKENEVHKIQEIKVIDFYLNQYTRSAKFLRRTNSKPLPSFIRIKHVNNKDERRWVDVMFNKKELLNQFKTFTAIHNEEVYIKIDINVADLNKSKVWLQSKDKKVTLDNWYISER